MIVFPTVDIGDTAYTVYQDTDEISEYANALIGDQGDGWRAADADTQARGAVMSTRLINRLLWQGIVTPGGEDGFAWPRSQLYCPDGITPVDPDTVPQALYDANSEIATSYVAGLIVQPDPNTEATRILKAGSVMIEYFRSVDGTMLPLPQVVMQLVGYWLGGSTMILGSEASGTDGRTSFGRKYDVIQPS